MVSGTEGYAEQAESLIAQYEAIPFDLKYRVDRGLLPAAPCRVLDVGAGTGADAAWLAARGDRVVAVEPTAPLRAAAARLHPYGDIEWVDDHLPDLRAVQARGERFDLILLTAVWMHLDAGQRRSAMPVVANLLAPGGRLFLAIRQGPVPEGRRMFQVPVEETLALARAWGLSVLLNELVESVQPANRAAGVRWQRCVFAS